jgi:hypothetical protein
MGAPSGHLWRAPALAQKQKKTGFNTQNPKDRAIIMVTKVADGRAPSGVNSSMNPDTERCDGDGMSWDELPALFEADPSLFK